MFVVNLAELERQLGRNEHALRTLDMLEGSGPDSVQRAHAAYIRGRTLLQMDRLDEARTSLLAAGTHPVFEAPAAIELVRVAQAQGREEEAMEIRARLRWLAPERPAPSLDYADSLRRSGSMTAALATLRWVIGRHPDNVRARVMFVEVQLELGDLRAVQSEIAAMEARGMIEPAGRMRLALDRERGLAREPENPSRDALDRREGS